MAEQHILGQNQGVEQGLSEFAANIRARTETAKEQGLPVPLPHKAYNPDGEIVTVYQADDGGIVVNVRKISI